MSWTRTDYPMDARKPVTHVRWSCDGVSIRASADGVHVEGTLPQSMSTDVTVELASTLHEAALMHSMLRNRETFERTTR